MSFGPLVQTRWLADKLDETDLRVFDSTVLLRRAPEGSGRPYSIVSGRERYESGHIPGAVFLDLIGELSDPEAPHAFTMPAVETLAAALAARGLGDEHRVVLYSTGSVMWATRVWWMLRSLGLDRVAVLDGGWKKWQVEGHPVSTEISHPPAASLSCNPRPEMWASRTEVEASIESASVCTLNALAPDSYDGSSAHHYGRPGHIPGSHNVFYDTLLDPDDGTFLPPKQLALLYRESKALDSERVINYCGGGISATMDALALSLLGHPDIAVYDGSMTEWAADPELPLVTGV